MEPLEDAEYKDSTLGTEVAHIKLAVVVPLSAGCMALGVLLLNKSLMAVATDTMTSQGDAVVRHPKRGRFVFTSSSEHTMRETIRERLLASAGDRRILAIVSSFSRPQDCRSVTRDAAFSKVQDGDQICHGQDKNP